MTKTKWYEVLDECGVNIAATYNAPEKFETLQKARAKIRSLIDLYPDRTFVVYAVTLKRHTVQALA